MKDKILHIKEIKDKYCGYEVTTTHEIISILIDNNSRCCEHYGYMSTNDDINEFVGATLFNIELTDTSLNTTKIDAITEGCHKDGYYRSDIDVEQIQFVNFITNRGIMQLVVYNYHNGYYGHEILIKRVAT